MLTRASALRWVWMGKSMIAQGGCHLNGRPSRSAERCVLYSFK
jgi:hypothetical protein